MTKVLSCAAGAALLDSTNLLRQGLQEEALRRSMSSQFGYLDALHNLSRMIVYEVSRTSWYESNGHGSIHGGELSGVPQIT